MEIIRGTNIGPKCGINAWENGHGTVCINKGKFGQVYITTCRQGVVKAWHKHERQTDRICIIKGMARLVVLEQIEKDTSEANCQGCLSGPGVPKRASEISVPNMEPPHPSANEARIA